MEKIVHTCSESNVAIPRPSKAYFTTHESRVEGRDVKNVTGKETIIGQQQRTLDKISGNSVQPWLTESNDVRNDMLMIYLSGEKKRCELRSDIYLCSYSISWYWAYLFTHRYEQITQWFLITYLHILETWSIHKVPLSPKNIGFLKYGYPIKMYTDLLSLALFCERF